VLIHGEFDAGMDVGKLKRTAQERESEGGCDEEKRGVPRPHGKHAAWELLSPDLRCFCKSFCGKVGINARARRECE
jgi:hypothetical protein